MHWEKLGIIYAPDGAFSWASSHAMAPTPFRLNEHVIRVFTTFCDNSGVGRPGYVDLAANNLRKVIGVSREPLLDLGKPGTFDENGVLACSIVRVDDKTLYMYYVGFELGTKIRYRLLTGLAISEDNGKSFHRYSTTPILERSSAELFFRGGPYCILDDEGLFRMWYVAGSGWENLNGKEMPVYDIRYAESKDGLIWPSKGDEQISVTEPDEYGFGRPAVIPYPYGFRMFYSIRRRSYNSYRLGYAVSKDGRDWRRQDARLNLDVSTTGFDSEAIMYAAPFAVKEKLYVFYNGNQFGRDGFAVASLVAE